MNLIQKLKSYFSWKLAFSLSLGALAGYAYFYFIGCSGGGCPITSSATNSVLYGMMVGGLLGFEDKNKRKGNKEADQNIEDTAENTKPS
ncbi:MAG: hypothetical protein C0594_14450 [Marinilabiliales bacterium]|nr:MAG: hypothetical protein C0594_14450 [Marinilabiliales bacterium]